MILFNHKQHPDKLRAAKIEAFLTFLAAQRKVSASIQSIALNALVFIKTKCLPGVIAAVVEKILSDGRLAVRLQTENERLAFYAIATGIFS